MCLVKRFELEKTKKKMSKIKTFYLNSSQKILKYDKINKKYSSSSCKNKTFLTK